MQNGTRLLVQNISSQNEMNISYPTSLSAEMQIHFPLICLISLEIGMNLSYASLHDEAKKTFHKLVSLQKPTSTITLPILNHNGSREKTDPKFLSLDKY